ncbi:MAG: phosphotransferase [Dissulfurispiraceae bacterium]
MREPLKCFILAAGLGQRLGPITNYIPKPLLPIMGKPLLASVLEKVSILPMREIGINLHHKKNVIADWVARSEFHERVVLFPEEQILGTGGALKNAESFLSGSVFLVHNADILSDIALEELLESHLLSHNLVTLAVHDFPLINSISIDHSGSLKCIGKSSHHQTDQYRWVTFTGIAVYSSRFLDFLPSGISNVVDSWLVALAAGNKVGTYDATGCHWSDIGTPEAYAQTVVKEMRSIGETVSIHPSTVGCDHAELDGYIVIEKDNVLKNGSFRNCIVLPSSLSSVVCPDDDLQSPFLVKEMREAVRFENCIIGPGFSMRLAEWEMLGWSRDSGMFIGTGGSDRKYFRVKREQGSAVMMRCLDGDPDYERSVEFTRFFHQYSIPVPELVFVDRHRMEALFEDLGDMSLYSWLKCPREEWHIEGVYKKVLSALIHIHVTATDHVAECPLLKERIFDYEHLRWETGYFMERFLGGLKNLIEQDAVTLLHEFDRLAVKVDAFQKTVIHRDFQSQNIMITKGETPRLIDYQGARIGPPAYDVASILWDPYYRLGSKMRERLLQYYIDEMTIRAHEKFDETEFTRTLIPCRLQRHMQALGAYSFLSMVKGKKYFLKFIEEGLRLLDEDASVSRDDYPALYDLLKRL